MEMETLPSGTQLHGRYRVERVLGNGGFGHVYLAIDLQTGQQYAIKEYLVTGAGGKAQLEHEARVLSQLHHPSLPAYQDAFDERGRYYIVLSYIEGRDLTDCIRAARLRNEAVPLERTLNWLISICEAVTFLHNQHPPIIHRDIKPDNIRITLNGTAFLVDMGNAKASADGARTLLFIRHQGTPGYAPLEQYPGGTGTDTRSDVYALGGTLFFALTAQEPPSVSTRKQSSDQGLQDLPSLQELLRQNPPENAQDPKQFRLGVNKPAKPRPRHSYHLAQLGALSPDLLNRLNLIIARAMAMDPWDRYQSVAELNGDLQRVRAALPSSIQQAQSKAERPFDPHSTQPDLPFLFDAMQNVRGNTAPPAPDGAAKQSTPPAPAAPLRCPRCQAEVTRASTFCSRCGAQLNNISPQNNQDDDSTILITPPSSRAKSMPGTGISDKKDLPTGGSAIAPTMTQRSSMSSSQQMFPRPFMQSIATPPSANGGQPFSPANSGQSRSTSSIVPGAQTDNQSTAAHQRSGLPNFLLFFVIVAVVVIIAVVIFLLVHHSTGGNGANAPTLSLAGYFSTGAQVNNYERIISFSPFAASAHPGTGVW